MSSRARKIAKRAVEGAVCAASSVEEPCIAPVRYRATVAFVACQHQTPGDPIPLCHLHAWAAQRKPQAPGAHICPYCKQIGPVSLVHMADA